MAPIDVPPFDRSNVDGFAVRSADLASAGEATPVRLMLNDEVIACGIAPMRPVLSGTATSIATGGPVPRGADAIVMVEHTQPAGPRAIEIRRAASPGQFVSYAGSDIARGEALLRAGTIIGSREIGMLAACGIAQVSVARRPRVAIISTGDELVQPGQPLRPAAIYDTNGAIVTAAITENGGEAHFLGAIPDDEAQLEAAMRKALETSDMLVLSGGTSKGAGDVSHRIIGRLGQPGIIAHGVALKPGKPLCLAVCDGKPVVILPGFPTSAMFTFHDMIVPVLRRMAGLPPRSDAKVSAQGAGADRVRTRPHRIRHGVAGRRRGRIDRLSHRQGLRRHHVLRAGRRLSAHRRAGRPDAGGHRGRGDAVHAACAGAGSRDRRQPLHRARSGHRAAGARRPRRCARSRSAASAGWRRPSAANAISRRSICSTRRPRPTTRRISPTGSNWCRAGGACRASCSARAIARFEGLSAEDAVRAALADPACIMVNRNQGAGTRILIDRLLGGARPDGYWNQPRSHNAVAAAVAQHRADWGMTIAPVAHASDLGFIPFAEEHYDFALVKARKQRPAVQAFLDALASEEGRAALEQAGFRPA